jgi:hypothetical protein
LALHLEFGGQAVGVPAESAFDLVTAHRPIARHDVLDVAGQQMPVVREAVRERWPVVEDVLLGAVASVDARAEGVVGGPELEHVEFQRGKVRRAAGRLRVCAHSCVVSCAEFEASGLGSRRFRHGDDVAHVRDHRGTTPLAHQVRRSWRL